MPSQCRKSGSRVKRKRRQASRVREKGRYSRSPTLRSAILNATCI